MVARSSDRALESLARRQHGVFHRRQALRIGFTRRMVQRRLECGAWIRMAGDVFALPSHPGTWRRQCMAASLTVPAGAVAESAAVLHGAPDFRPGRIQVVTRHGTTHRSALADARESRTIGRLIVVDGIRVVSKADCTIQLAGATTLDRLRSTLAFFNRTDRHYLAELRDRQIVLARSRLRGMSSVRTLLAEIDDDDPPSVAHA